MAPGFLVQQREIHLNILTLRRVASGLAGHGHHALDSSYEQHR